ncbi:hypothetical protein [Amycolatopsis dongchuanensis]|uniref:Uncharacterized protein n=1 Tax=Amycolatopsis dongchuanensis TaxID=1070866 RepID=A0ABP8VTV8_9PSEU
MFLFCLLIAYVIVRVSEDITAAVRKEPPPRQKIREAKLAARERNGGRVPQGSFGRYLSGLIDDAWDSAHHKRELMADHRREKQARKAAAKQERDRQRWARKDAKRGGAGFGAEVPNPGETTPAAGIGRPGQPGQRPGQPGPAGFYAQVPQPGQGPAAQPSPQPTGYSRLTPEQRQLVDAWMRANSEGRHFATSLPDYFGLPADVRADMVADAWRVGFRPGGTVDGREVPISEWDPDAVRLLRERGITEPPRPDPVPEPPERQPTGGLRPAAAPAGQPSGMPESPAAGATPAAGKSAPQKAAEDAEAGSEAGGAEEKTDPVPDAKEVAETPLPDNVIPFKRDIVTTTRMELPVTNPEITGLDGAIAYAQGMASQCTHAYDQISAILPTGDETAASCEQARADLEAGGVTGQALTDISSVQEQMTGAIQELQAALAQLEAAAAAANSLSSELESHRGVQEAYAATPDAGSKEFVTAE